ncbi:MAG: DNA-3-methyladenine glycosylase I [Thermoplasmata archaeon]|nr:DNA-3-methyladenine glycosylase I [Thermoplasmata archaeon]
MPNETDPVGANSPRRCAWALGDPLLQAYHDVEWGVPEYDGQRLWEKLSLDGFQAGLSWLTILRKREAFRAAFRGFDPTMVARFGPRDVRRLLSDAGIVRSRSKIEATIAGARAYLTLHASGTNFAEFVWSFTGGRSIQATGPVPAQTPLSAQISAELKHRGFRFVGPVIVYAWMQAVGMVNDHSPGCFRRAEVRRPPFPVAASFGREPRVRTSSGPRVLGVRGR